jgi:hypothetical protein
VPVANDVFVLEIRGGHVQELSDSLNIIFGQIYVTVHVTAPCATRLASEANAVH